MKILEIPYPENLPDVSQLSTVEFERDLKMALASKLFELGRLSSGQAAELAGIPRVAFLKDLSRFQVNALSWNSDEIEQEVENA
jgi:predicted HTH domain antitoxin